MGYNLERLRGIMKVKKVNEDSAILILSDMEGVSGLIDSRLQNAGSIQWKEYGRSLITDDVNMVAAACLAKGYKNVYLSEAHNYGKNTLPELLLPMIKVLPTSSAQTNIQGTKIWEEIYQEKNIVAAIMIGIHPMQGAKGYLPHSWDGGAFKNIKINGKEHGEIGTIAALLGHYDIPLIAIVGDAGAAKEAEECIKGIKAISVKEQLEDGWVKALPPTKAHELIFKEISSSLENIDNVEVFKLTGDVEMSFELRNKEQLALFKDDNSVSIKDDIVYINASNYKEAYNTFWDCYLKIMFNR